MVLRIQMSEERLALAPWFVLEMKYPSESAVYQQHTFEARCDRWHRRRVFSRELTASRHRDELPSDMACQTGARSLGDIIDLQQGKPLLVSSCDHCTCKGML